MRKFMQAIIFVSALAACNAKPATSPLETDMVVLTPGKKLHVYTDALSDTSVLKRKGQPQKKLAIPLNPITGNLAHPMPPAIITMPPAPPSEVDAISSTAPVQPGPQINNTAIKPPVINKPDTVRAIIKSVVAKKEKDEWSNATKGAVLGGVGGAIGGAIISKKKGQGAILGGIIGATGGYILGRAKDNKQATDSNHFAPSN